MINGAMKESATLPWTILVIICSNDNWAKTRPFICENWWDIDQVSSLFMFYNHTIDKFTYETHTICIRSYIIFNESLDLNQQSGRPLLVTNHWVISSENYYYCLLLLFQNCNTEHFFPSVVNISSIRVQYIRYIHTFHASHIV